MLVNTWPTFEMLMRKVQDAQLVIYDSETSGLDWRVNHPIGHVVTFSPDPADSFYVPVRHAGGGNLPDLVQVPTSALNWDGSVHRAERELAQALRHKFVVGHNLAFDLKATHRAGFRFDGKLADTMIAAYLTNEIRKSLSLDACCRDEGVQEKKGDALYAAIAAKTGSPATREAMAYLWQMPGDDATVVDYACGDGTSTFQLWDALWKKINTVYYQNATGEYSLRQIADVEFALIPVLHRMSMKGIKIDEQQLHEVTKQIRTEFEDGLLAIGDMNVKSPIQVKAYFEKHGVTDWPLTEKGAPSFPEAFLKTNEPGKKLLAVRKNRTLLDNFLIPMPSKFLYKGRAHTDFHQTRDEEFGTRTGRLSTTGPNLGAMPGKRQGDLGKLFRSIFIPDDGMQFWEADYAAMEIRICAHYCKAKAWVDGLRAGLDPHTAISNELGIVRKHAKTINLALMTGAGKNKIASELGLPMAEGLAVVNRYFEGLPELRSFQKKAANSFESRGFLSTLLGRRLHLADRSKSYTAVNRLTQGGNADVIKSAMGKIDAIMPDTLTLTVYDSALFQTEIGDTDARDVALNTMVNMETIGIPNFYVPMEIEYGGGMNWGEATFNVEGKKRWEPHG